MKLSPFRGRILSPLWVALTLTLGAMPGRAQTAQPDSVRPAEAVHIPDIAGIERVNKTGNILFWLGQTKYLFALGGSSNGAAAIIMALQGAQEVGLGLNYYANRSLLRTYRGMGGEESFLRTGAGSLYLADKAVTVGSLGLIGYGVAKDRSNLAVVGAVGLLLTNLMDFYVWHQLSQGTEELRSGIRNWNAGAGLRDGGFDLAIAYALP